MKNNNTSKSLRNTFIILLGLISFSSILANYSNVKINLSDFKLSSFTLPDTIPWDSTNIADTLDVTAIYEVTDTASVFTDGLDTITVLQEDTTIFIAQQDSSLTYYIGDPA